MLSKLRRAASQLDVYKLLDECIIETRGQLVALVRSQLDEGQSAIGDLPEYKNRWYRNRKLRMNPSASGKTDLKLTGSFQDRFFVKMSKYSVIVRSSDKKNSKLLSTYGPEIFDLNDNNLDAYIKILVPLMQKKIRDGLFK